jgi:hypothetical protein
VGLFVPNNPSFGYVTGNVLATRPAAAFGTSITPGTSNSYGSYTEILGDANVTRDCYGMMLNFNSSFVTVQARDILATIGIDVAGGSSYVDFISHLLASCAGSFDEGHGGHWYYFPVFIPAGAAIAAKASVNNGTASTMRCAIWLYGAPKNLSGLVYGQGVETVGAVTASSRGTAVTPGTTSEGSWTSIGTTTRKWKFAQHGMGINDTSLTSGGAYANDLSFGDGTNNILLDQDKMHLVPNTTEALSAQLRAQSYCDVPLGETIYGRSQCSGTPDSNVSMAAYGVY